MKRISLFTICFLIFIASWVFLRFVIGGPISVPIPSSVIAMYMALILIAILVHVSVEDTRFEEFIRPIHETLVDEKRSTRRLVLAILIPILMLGYTYTNIAQKANPPGDPRGRTPFTST